MQKPISFILSGIISFSFYIFICFLFIYYVASPKVKTYIFESKATVIELDMISKVSDKKRVEKKEDKKIEEKVEPVKETSISNEKKPDLKSLFGKVKIKETKVATKEVNNISKSLDPKRFKAKFEKEKKSSNVKIDTLLTDTKTTTNTKKTSSSKGKESNEYYSRVQALLDEFTPSTREENLKSVVIIKINSRGGFSYRIVSYSENESFNSSLKAFLEEQKSIVYPKPKNNKILQISVDFKSEG